MAVTVDSPLGWNLCVDDAEIAIVDPFLVSSGVTGTHFVETPGLSRVALRLRRTSGLSVDADCSIVAFGQDLRGDWTRLTFDPSDRKDGDFQATFVTKVEDTDNGTFQWSEPIDLILGDAMGFKVHVLKPAGIGISARIECKLEKPSPAPRPEIS
jgi:hypothetical protein